MSHLVLLGEQPSASELAVVLERVLGSAAAPASLGALAKDGKLADLLEQGVFKNQAGVLALSEEDLSAVLALAFAVVAQLTVASEAAAATTKLASLLTTDAKTRAPLKIRALTNLINVVGGLNTVAPAQRFAVLLQMLEFALAATTGAAASATSPAALVLQPLSTLSSLVDFWKLTPEQSLALYSASYKLASVAGAARKEPSPTATYNLGAQPTLQHEYLFALLKAVDAAGAAKPDVLKEKANQDLAVAAVVASVSNGLSAQVHTLDPSHVYPLAIVQSLSASNSAAASAAFSLLKIVVNGDIAGFAAWEKSHAAFLKEQAATLDAPTLLRKLRTLALCQLAVANQAASSVDNVLKYADIRAKLNLAPAEDVEGAVIDAVMAGRLDAKMDQETETLCVKRVTGGVPLSLYSGPDSKAAWSALGARLKTWKANIHTVLTTLNLSQQVDPQDAAEDL